MAKNGKKSVQKRFTVKQAKLTAAQKKHLRNVRMSYKHNNFYGLTPGAEPNEHEDEMAAAATAAVADRQVALRKQNGVYHGMTFAFDRGESMFGNRPPPQSQSFPPQESRPGPAVAAHDRPAAGFNSNNVPPNNSNHVSVGGAKAAPPAGGRKASYVLVTGMESFRRAMATVAVGSPTLSAAVGGTVIMDIEGLHLGSDRGTISLLQMVSPGWSAALLFDVDTLNTTAEGVNILGGEICTMLRDKTIIKVLHDLTNDTIALRRFFGDDARMDCVVDTQIAHEALGGGMMRGLNSTVEAFDGVENWLKNQFHRKVARDPTIFSRRPFTPELLAYAAQDVLSLLTVFNRIRNALLDAHRWDDVMLASQVSTRRHLQNGGAAPSSRNANTSASSGGDLQDSRDRPPPLPLGVERRVIITDGDEEGEAHSAPEHLSSRAGNGAGGGSGRKSPSVWNDVRRGNLAGTEQGLRVLPERFLLEQLNHRCVENLEGLCEVVMDEGSRPWADIRGRRVYLCNDDRDVVTSGDVARMVQPFEEDGAFGNDDRAGFNGQLHRLSVMRNRGGRIYGVTLRVGRYFEGSADLIDDLLFHVPSSGPPHSGDPKDGLPPQAPSILVLGRPGAGKTTVIREICRKVSGHQTVVIVDTSNEIAGEGTVPHAAAIGASRRMMVPRTTEQHSVMIQALQNHTPQTIVVDEISNFSEARACRDIKARGVRLVASAHGDLQSVLSNPDLNSLLGGKNTVTLGDDRAKQINKGDKVQVQRAGAPTFDMVVEVARGQANSWTIIRSVGRAVDDILQHGNYKVEKRMRIPKGDVSEGEADSTFLLGFDTVTPKRIEGDSLRLFE